MKDETHRHSENGTVGTGTTPTVTDPVCGMEILPSDSVGTHTHDGRTYYFCNESCLDRFREDPRRYLEPGRSGDPVEAAPGSDYICPMDPEVRQKDPGACPKCGMALEPETVAAPATRTEYVCPMHPEVVQDHPGACPICGMALEPRTVAVEEKPDPELISMSRRFWIGVAFSLPLLLLAMSASELVVHIGRLSQDGSSVRLEPWLELLFASPVVLWGGWPFFVRGWRSIVTRNLNMFTLIAIGTGTAYVYSVVATIFPDLFPLSFRHSNGQVGVYFEAAAVITVLVLLGQVLELRARSRT
ncbi:MAG: YHS domain-containing protein, partial [Nitrospirae bacterium]|nr:YHS domain-containing protein [Nitrospirota bacterium]